MLEQRQMITPVDEKYDIFFDVINRFLGLFSMEAQQESQNDPATEYPFVAMDTRQVFDQIQFVSQYLWELEEGGVSRSYSFIDIGCGIGNVLLFAEQFGFDVHGIEKDPNPCQVAVRLFGKERILAEDVFSFQRYGHFDVVYYFRPLADKEQQIRFEQLVEQGMRPGALLVANGKYSALDGNPAFIRLHETLPVWQKASAQS